MSGRISRIFALLSFSLILSNCSTEQINAVNKITTDARELAKNITISVNNDFNLKDLEEIQVDDKKLSSKDFRRANNKLQLDNLASGKHIVKFKHKEYGYTELPVEVKANQENNFQFNPNVVDNKINDWELGVDANNDGKIDDNAFLSRQVSNYVVVRESSGQTNYLPKENFRQDFRANKSFPKPENFREPEPRLPGSDRRPAPPPVFLSKEANPGQMNDPSRPLVQNSQNNQPLNAKVSFPLPAVLNNYKLVGIMIDSHILPDNTYLRSSEALLLNNEFLKGKDKNIKLYLIDETGQGVLLGMSTKRPVINEKNSNIGPNKNIVLEQQDINYSLQKNIKIDLNKLEELKGARPENFTNPPTNFQNPGSFSTRPHPEPPPVPKARRGEPVKLLQSKGLPNKIIKIDENGEIVDYIDKTPESEADIAFDEIMSESDEASNFDHIR